jgi:hypothetical protein
MGRAQLVAASVFAFVSGVLLLLIPAFRSLLYGLSPQEGVAGLALLALLVLLRSAQAAAAVYALLKLKSLLAVSHGFAGFGVLIPSLAAGWGALSAIAVGRDVGRVATVAASAGAPSMVLVVLAGLDDLGRFLVAILLVLLGARLWRIRNAVGGAPAYSILVAATGITLAALPLWPFAGSFWPLGRLGLWTTLFVGIGGMTVLLRAAGDVVLGLVFLRESHVDRSGSPGARPAI